MTRVFKRQYLWYFWTKDIHMFYGPFNSPTEAATAMVQFDSTGTFPCKNT